MWYSVVSRDIMWYHQYRREGAMGQVPEGPAIFVACPGIKVLQPQSLLSFIAFPLLNRHNIVCGCCARNFCRESDHHVVSCIKESTFLILIIIIIMI